MLYSAISQPGMYLIYIAAAVIPAVFLMRYIYNHDTYEKEPASLLWNLVFLGFAATGISLLLEIIADDIVLPLFSFSSQTFFAIIEAVCIGLIEEGAKFYFLYRRTWNDVNFNYLYDGIVYAVFVSLGFATLENIMYVLQYGLSVAASRALLAVPAHMGFAVFMGSYYGRAKLYDMYGFRKKCHISLIAAYFSAAALHAVYDASAMIGTVFSTVVFLVFVIMMYRIIIQKVISSSQENRRIW